VTSATTSARRQVDVIAAFDGTASVLAAKAATSSIPIAFITAADPVKLGLVASLNRPGGNLTGVTILSVELGAKLFEMSHALVPKATIVALLINPTNPFAETLSRDAAAVARTLGLELHGWSGLGTKLETEPGFSKITPPRLRRIPLSAVMSPEADM
jgi:putative tryptophan/tyrosine transport system substrate-binding protein